MARDNSIEVNDRTRTRVVEMSDRMYPRLAPLYVAAGILLLASTPLYGWWVALPVLIDAAKAALARRLVAKGHDAEFIYVADQYTSVLMFSVAIFFAGGAHSPFFPFLASFAGLFPVLFTGRPLRRSFLFLVAATLLAALGPAKPVDYEVFLRLGTILCVMLILRVYALELMNSDLHYRQASRIDSLTGLGNRRSFESELARLERRLVDQDATAALVIGDIDHFKRINDEHGHGVGDIVLRDVAAELKSAFRSEDLAFRIGGEEFALIAVGVTPEFAQGMAESIRDRIEISYPGGFEITMSFGVSMYRHGEPAKKWLARSDAALYDAKRLGRNRVEFARSGT